MINPAGANVLNELHGFRFGCTLVSVVVNSHDNLKVSLFRSSAKCGVSACQTRCFWGMSLCADNAMPADVLHVFRSFSGNTEIYAFFACTKERR